MSNAEFEDFEDLENLDDQAESAMVESVDPFEQDSSETGTQRSSRGALATGATSSETAGRTSRFGWVKKMTLYESMLLVSALFIAASILLMAREYMSFGGIFQLNWNTSEAVVEPISLP